MTEKWGRQYKITIDLGDGGDPLIIQLPFTIQFSINRSLGSSVNSLYLDIYNLSPKVRDLIFQERWVPRNKTITLEAGYPGCMAVIYKGTIFDAGSRREDTNMITSLECMAGSFDVDSTSVYATFQKGKTLSDVIAFLGGQFPNVKLGVVGDFKDVVLLRPWTLNGNVWDLLKRYSGNTVVIDNDELHAVKTYEVIEGELTLMNVDSGLLQTPRRAGQNIQVQAIFEPRIKLNQALTLESTTLKVYNGTYKVVGVQHTGVISAAVSGECRTTIDLYGAGTAFSYVKAS